MDHNARDEVIAYKPLNQIVFERLHGDILRGALRPGDPLRQEDITERLGVSRTPVREAIRRLQAEGLVTSSPRKGAVVAELPLKKVREIYQIRGQLEAFAAELAIDHLNAKDLTGLRKLITEMEALDPERDLEKILDKNRKFHYVIYSASGNDTLVEMIDQLWRDIQRLRSRYLLTPHGHRHSTSEHLGILKALEARDHARLRELVRQHCERAQQSLTANSVDGQP
ncbi:MAG TPA: GntR family transcriptional regulator [Bryobacteraceae bacterium]|nr:GntR family transcriptional regulator [Bryobacteraceae bacterium]